MRERNTIISLLHFNENHIDSVFHICGGHANRKRFTFKPYQPSIPRRGSTRAVIKCEIRLNKNHGDTASFQVRKWEKSVLNLAPKRIWLVKGSKKKKNKILKNIWNLSMDDLQCDLMRSRYLEQLVPFSI